MATPDLPAAVREARRALHALALELPESVHRDASQRIEAAFLALIRERDEARRRESDASNLAAHHLSRAEAAEKALEEARADTERLDWLNWRGGRVTPYAGRWTAWGPDECAVAWDQTLRAAIDAARSAEGENQ